LSQRRWPKVGPITYSYKFSIAAQNWLKDDNEHIKMVEKWLQSREGEAERQQHIYEDQLQKYNAAVEVYDSLQDIEGRVDYKMEEWKKTTHSTAAEPAGDESSNSDSSGDDT